jgi:hypothetical protein
VLVVMGAATTAQAQTYGIGGKTYVPAGPTEVVTANFNPADGGVSVGTYAGYVRLVVSGSGVSCTPATNDAFYIYVWQPGCSNPNVVPQHDPSWYQLTFDSQTLVGGNYTRDATRFIVYDIDAGAEVLSRPYVPAYRTGHTYSFIVDTGLVAAARLHFGVSDGGFGDNSGAFQVQITQLAPRPATPFDADADGTSDLRWRHTTGGDIWLWSMIGGVRAADAYVGVVSDPNWEIRGQGDLDGDGMADLLWRHKLNGTIYYWKMSGPTPVAQLYVSTVHVSYDIVGTADFDRDGRADILWRNPTAGDLWLWRMNGAAVLGQHYIDTVASSYAIKGLGDVNGDLKADVVWQGAAGDVWVWLMNGGARDAQARVGMVSDGEYQIQQVADFDGDRKADLLWRNTVQGDVWLWTMDGAAVAAEECVGVVPDTNYRIQAAGDYDGDGKADILWHHATAGDVWVWLMNGATKLSEHYVGGVPDTGYQIVEAK